MNFASFLIVLAVLGMIGFSVFYIIKEKKKGNPCIGCPYGKTCTRYQNNKSEKKI